MTQAEKTPIRRDRPDLSFDPVPVRERFDGWTPEKQVAFIDALAECGCVADACRQVGMSAAGAYKLRRNFAAREFRHAWEAALNYGIRRLSDAVIARAIHGVAVPHFYKGEIVGEHRRYDERLAMFLMRYRDPLVYGTPPEQGVWIDDPELLALRLARRTHELAKEPPRGPRAADGRNPVKARKKRRAKRKAMAREMAAYEDRYLEIVAAAAEAKIRGKHPDRKWSWETPPPAAAATDVDEGLDKLRSWMTPPPPDVA